jgi:hypothetical protein
VETNRERQNHWIRHNHQNRIPSRWIAFDTEARKEQHSDGETQSWRLGCAVKWRTDLATGNQAVYSGFDTPAELWQWVTGFCKPKTRTVVWAHNLGYDIRISQAMELLPELGWRLDWCNLGAQVSTMTWRSDQGTLTFADLTAWLPMSLEKVGELVGIPKMRMPNAHTSRKGWVEYCMNDVRILHKAVDEIVSFVRSEDLGNWQPTGAGMAFATWRHKFLSHKVLVHNDMDAIAAERAAMHTGRAEAWKHGTLKGDIWTELDLRQAYVHIARDTDLPTKLKWHTGPLTLRQYDELRGRFRVLVRAEVRTAVPAVPCNVGGRVIWPVGTFTTWLWDCELDMALDSAEQVIIRESYVYTRAPVLAEWAAWVLDVQRWDDEKASPVIKRWIKHSGRTLIGRIALRTASWAVWGSNPEQEAGISYIVDAETGTINRLMHVGEQTMVEEARVEGQDSLPQITGYIMSESRRVLWTAMVVAGLDNIAHVDTDSILVNSAGLARLSQHYGELFASMWQPKATYRVLTVYGPRNYRAGYDRKVSGIPKQAVEVEPNTFAGESWSSMAGDMAAGRQGTVTITYKQWRMATKDPRRMSRRGSGTGTEPIRVDQRANSSSVDVATSAAGS